MIGIEYSSHDRILGCGKTHLKKKNMDQKHAHWI